MAAGEANLERRNQDFQEIKRKMVFERRADSKNPSLVDHLTIQSHEYVFCVIVCQSLDFLTILYGANNWPIVVPRQLPPTN